MKLYDFAFSPNCRQVRAVAYELGISLDYIHVDLLQGASRTERFLALNPNGLVPVLVDGAFTLFESTAIIRYLSAQRGGALLPPTLQGKADVDRWLAWRLAHLGPAMSTVASERIVKKLTGRGAPDETAVARGSAEFARLSALLDRALAQREYVAGPLSLADFSLASYYSLAAMCGLDMDPWHNVRAWLTRVLDRPSMQRALADANALMSDHAA